MKALRSHLLKPSLISLQRNIFIIPSHDVSPETPEIHAGGLVIKSHGQTPPCAGARRKQLLLCAAGRV